MAEWRFGHGWTEREIEERLERAGHARRDSRPAPRRWRRMQSECIVAREPTGPPLSDGPYRRAAAHVRSYSFSDTRIVVPYFEKSAPLLGRRVLLELRALGLRYLTSVVVGAVRDEQDERRTLFGFRIDTLPGHLERGSEWFIVEKRHDCGDVRFRIEAWWRHGEFPNLWSHAGFVLVGPIYQRLWHRRSQQRLAELTREEQLTGSSDATRPALP